MNDCSKCKHYRVPVIYSARDTQEPGSHAECGIGHWLQGIHMKEYASCEDFKKRTWWQENKHVVFLALIALYIIVALLAEYGLLPGGN